MPPQTNTPNRAKVISMIQRKGGAGKSTLTVNLAAVSGQSNPPADAQAACPVVAAGIDPQGSMEDWADRVPEDKLPFDYLVTKGELGLFPKMLTDQTVRRVFVDTPGFMDINPTADFDADPLGTGPAAQAMQEVLDVTDLALVPITTHYLTWKPAEFTIERVLKPRGIKFLVVINMWDSGSDRGTERAPHPELTARRAWCDERMYPYAQQAIRHYKIHSRAPEDGLTVIQYAESGTALRAREDFYRLALTVEQAL